jgi:hypothetical protein
MQSNDSSINKNCTTNKRKERYIFNNVPTILSIMNPYLGSIYKGKDKHKYKDK